MERYWCLGVVLHHPLHRLGAPRKLMVTLLVSADVEGGTAVEKAIVANATLTAEVPAATEEVASG